MKILKIGDLHVGARSGNEHMRSFIKSYLMDYVIPYMVENDIKHFLQAGDFFDVRRSLYGRDRQWIVDEFIPLLEKHDLHGMVIPGNHDISNRNTIAPNWVDWLAAESDGRIICCNEASDYTIGDLTVCMVPWICRENYDNVLKAIQSSKAKYCMGHFELAGFPMYPGTICEEGIIDTKLLSKFEVVDSGHFHTRSKIGNIEYLGTPYHLNWQDYQDGDNRGFYVMDTDTLESEFIRNKSRHTLFRTFDYDYSIISDDKVAQDNLLDKSWMEDVFGLKGKIIRVICRDRENNGHYKKFLATLRTVDCISHQVIDKTVQAVSEEILVDEETLRKDTLSVIKEKVQKTDGIDQPAVMTILEKSYRDCQEQTTTLDV